MLRRARTDLARLVAVLASLSLALCVGVVGSASAHADAKQALAQTKHDIASAKQQLAVLQNRAEAAAEHYNQGMLALSEAKRVAEQRQQAAAQAQHRLVAMRAQLSVFAVQMYKGDNLTGLSLVDGAQDPQSFVDRAAYSDQLSEQKAATLAALDTAEHDAAVTAAAAKQALTAQQAVVQRLAADKKQVDEASAQAQQVLADLQAKERKLVHEIQVEAARAAAARRAREAAAARRAAALAAQQAAALAAQQAAAQQAQQAFDNQPSSPPPAPSGSSGPVGNAAQVAVDWAKRELGKPYVWAAAGPDSFDCSGLTMYVYAKAGIYLPHFAASQYGYGHHVSSSDLRPGDLLFYGSPIHHVAIYIGGGEMIEAPHTGADVRISSWYRSDFVGATRLSG